MEMAGVRSANCIMEDWVVPKLPLYEVSTIYKPVNRRQDQQLHDQRTVVYWHIYTRPAILKILGCCFLIAKQFGLYEPNTFLRFEAGRQYLPVFHSGNIADRLKYILRYEKEESQYPCKLLPEHRPEFLQIRNQNG